MGKRCIGYARVSTAEQALNSHALEQQKRRLQGAGATEIFEDIQSGTRRDRANYRELERLIKGGQVNEVVVTRIDRLSRSLLDLRGFADLCVKNGANLRILDQQIDLSTPHGRFLLNIIGSAAELEVDMLRSRVAEGIRDARQQRRAPGVVPFGYLNRDSKYCPNHQPYYDSGKTYWQVAREIVETFLEIGSIRGTARIMGERYGARRRDRSDFPRENGLRYWLESPVLRGHLAYYYRTRGKEPEIVPNHHEALLSQEEAADISRALGLLAQGERDLSDPLPLAGLLICARCGLKCRAYRKYRQRQVVAIYWYCRGAYSAPATCIKGKGIRDEALELTVIAALTQRAAQLAQLASATAPDAVPDPPEVAQIEQSILALEGLSGDAIAETRTRLQNQIAYLRSQARAQQNVAEILKDDLQAIAADRDFWLWLDEASKRRLYRRFVDRVVFSDGEVQEVVLRV